MNPLLLDTARPLLRPPAPPRPAPLHEDLLDRVLEIVGSRAPSRIQAHDARCCRLARAWFEALAVSASLQQPGPPAWIRQHWNWGPVEWPLQWCRIPQLKTVDCGALAALARAALEAINETISGPTSKAEGKATALKTVAVQLIERFDPAAVENWRAAWKDNRTTPHWMWGDLVYHETVGILDGSRIAIWDPTDSDFAEPLAADTYASIQAIRVDHPAPHNGQSAAALKLLWRDLPLAPGHWIRLAP